MDSRIRDRRRRVRRERRLRRLRRSVILVGTVVVVALLVAVERSPLVGLAEVRVAGADRLTAQAVREAAGLELGTSTLRLPLDEAETRVESLPLVAEAVARRADPLTVEIRVRERTPVAVVVGRGRPAMVDEEGVVIARGRPAGLPLIDVGGARVPAPGDSVGASSALTGAHRVLTSLPGPLRTEVVRLRAGAPDELVIVLPDGVEVSFGRAVAIGEKVRALGVVLEDLGQRAVARIDVRTPRTPVVEPT